MHFAALLAGRLTVRITGVAIAIGGLALMGFGTVGAPLASGDVALAASSQANPNATSHGASTSHSATANNKGGGGSVNTNAATHPSNAGGSGGNALNNNAVNHPSTAGGGGGGNGNGNGAKDPVAGNMVTNDPPTGSDPTTTNTSNSRGDIFVEQGGQSFGPGNETDPHLGCGNVLVGSSGLSSTTGTFLFFAWRPSDNFELIPGATRTGTSASVPSSTLTSFDSQTPNPQQGDHYKVEFVGSNGETKYKTFWVNCGTATTVTTSSAGSSSSSSSRSSSSSSSSTTLTAPGLSTTTSVRTVTTTSAGRTVTTTSTARAAVAGATTKVPGTGADLEFGIGLALLLAGSGVVAASRLRRGGGR